MKHHTTTRKLRKSWMPVSLLTLAILGSVVRPVPAEQIGADSKVILVQQALKLKHFYYGDVDGNLDEATQGALRRFQFRFGLPGTGEMDDATVEALTGIAPSPAGASANLAPHAERAAEPDAQSGKKDDSFTSKGTALSTEQERTCQVGHERNASLIDPHATYTVQLPSWASQHRAPIQDRIEVRRAIPVAPAGASDGSGSSPEAVMTVPAYFTGQDGHVYTYYRKIRTKVADGMSSPTSIVGGGGTTFSVARELSDLPQIRGGSIADR